MRMRFLGLGLFALALAVLSVSCAGHVPDVDTTPTVRTSVDAHVGKSMTPDGVRIDNIAKEFDKNETVFAVVDVPGKIEGTLRVRWLRGDEQVKEQTVSLSDDVHAYSFQLPPAEGGNPTGDYTLEVYVNGNRAETEKFEVK
jgi:hypothetical protein